MKIKIVSGWSNPGGSTLAHINLCNLFLEKGVDATFYGPHSFHIGKTQAGRINEVVFEDEDIIISHYLSPSLIKCKKHILSCHETNLFPINDLNYKLWNKIHFVSTSQRDWHKPKHKDVVVIPNVIDPSLRKMNIPRNGLPAGIIGSIDPHKQTHVSIQRALQKHDFVILFGEITDQPYFMKSIAPYIEEGSVHWAGHENDKNLMYSQISEVYHSSLRESYNFVAAECMLLGIPYNGLPSTISSAEVWPREKIFNAWMNILED